MDELTPAQVLAIIGFLDTWGASRDAFHDWVTATATDGPDHDGYVEFPDKNGVLKRIITPAKLETLVPTGQPVEQVYRIFGGPSIVYAGEHEDIRAPFSMMVTRIWISLTAPDGAAIGAVGLRANVNVDGVPMLSTPLTVAPGQLLSTATGDDAPVIANPVIPEKSRLTFPVLMTGGGAKGLTYMLGGHRL